MRTFIIHRFLNAVLIMLIVGIVSFLLIHIIPGNPAEFMLGPKADEDAMKSLVERMGYDQPLYVQFVKWFSHVIRGDFGIGIYSKQPVISIISSRIEPSLIIGIWATFLLTLSGVSIGLISAVKQNSWFDQLSMTVSLTFASIPTFWLGLNFMLLFSGILHWLPSSGYPGILKTGDLSNLRYLVMPSLTVAIPSTGLIARLTRSYVLDVMRMDYITTARSKGVRENTVIVKHVLRNTLIPVVAVMGTTFAGIISMGVVVEVVFNIPGVGRLLVDTIFQRNYPILQGLLMAIAGIFVLVNLLCDIAYAVIDPRIRYA